MFEILNSASGYPSKTKLKINETGPKGIQIKSKREAFYQLALPKCHVPHPTWSPSTSVKPLGSHPTKAKTPQIHGTPHLGCAWKQGKGFKVDCKKVAL